MAARVLFFVVGLSAVGVACSLSTDFDQFTKGGGSDAGPGGSTSNEGGVVVAGDGGGTITLPDGGTATAPVCGPDTKLSEDAKNCGTCGHDCQSGGCRRGKCEAFVIAEGIDNPNGLAFTSAGVYVGSDEGLLLLQTDGNKRKKILGGGGTAPQFVTANATDVFFADFDAHAIRRLAIGTTEVVTIRDSVESVIGVAVSPSFIFFTREEQKLVQRMPLSTVPQPTAVIEDLSTTYLADGADWANGFLYVASFNDDTVIEVPDDGKSFDKKRSIHDGCGPYGVKVEGGYAYITCGKDGTLVQVRIDDSEEDKTLANGLDGPNGIALSPTSIYIAESDNGTVLQLAR